MLKVLMRPVTLKTLEEEKIEKRKKKKDESFDVISLRSVPMVIGFRLIHNRFNDLSIKQYILISVFSVTLPLPDCKAGRSVVNFL